MAKLLPLEVTMSELRDNLSAYLDAVEAGKTVTITRRGKPSAILAGVRDLPDPIDPGKLRSFREGLNIKLGHSVIVDARQDERY